VGIEAAMHERRPRSPAPKGVEDRPTVPSGKEQPAVATAPRRVVEGPDEEPRPPAASEPVLGGSACDWA